MSIRWSGLGLTYTVNGSRSYYDINAKLTNKTINELAYIKSTGINKLRANIIDFNDQIANNNTYKGQQNLVLEALRMGFYVIFGLTSNPTTLTSTNFGNYITAVLDVALWAQENCAAYPGMFELCIGNEEENHIDGSLTMQQVRDELRTLAADSQLVYTAGPISTAIAQGKEDNWITTDAGNISGLDKLSINVYGHSGAFDSFVTIINKMVTQYGSNTYISEFNLHSNWSGVKAGGITVGNKGFEDEYYTEIARRVDFIAASGMTSAYFFTHHENTDLYSIRLENTSSYGLMRPVWNALVGGRRSTMG